MLCELNKKELIMLINGTSPIYKDIQKYENAGYGHYIGGFVDEWQWDEHKLRQLTETELYDLYQNIKAQWGQQN